MWRAFWRWPFAVSRKEAAGCLEEKGRAVYVLEGGGRGATLRLMGAA
jgi:hypothetical protein